MERGVSIDALLGPPHGRYFGSIYREAERCIVDQRIRRSAQGWEVSARGRIDYPRGWGDRGGTPRVPHLSTIDALVLLFRIHSMVASVDGFELGAAALVLDNVSLRAGASAQVDLAAVPIRGLILCDETSMLMDVKIGQIHAHGTWLTTTAGIGDGSPEPHALGKISLEDIVVDALNFTAAGNLSSDPQLIVGDVESAYVANVVASSQLTQALISAIEGIPHEQSGNLWMRRYGARISSGSAYPGVRTVIDSHRTLTVRDRPFSVFEGCAIAAGISCRYSIAREVDR